jgi:type III secretory pathway component EscS
MAKQKSSITPSSNIFGVLFISGHENGVATYLGLSIVIIQHITFNQDDPLSNTVWTTTILHSNVHWKLFLVHKVDCNSWAEMNCYVRKLKTNLERSMNRMKLMANQKRRDISFNTSEWIFLKLHPYRQHTVFKRVHQKLASWFYGPYQILEKIRPVAYKLQLFGRGTHSPGISCVTA